MNTIRQQCFPMLFGVVAYAFLFGRKDQMNFVEKGREKVRAKKMYGGKADGRVTFEFTVGFAVSLIRRKKQAGLSGYVIKFNVRRNDVFWLFSIVIGTD